MKKLRIILFVFSLLLCVGFVTGCKKSVEKTGKGYGIVHKDYVGIAEIKIKDEKVTALTFEEVYLPSTWAKITNVEGVEKDLYISTTDSHNATVNLAKYIMVGDKKFTGELVDNAVIYKADGIDDLKTWIDASENNAKWYAEELLNGNVAVTNNNFVKQETIAFSGSTKEQLKKSTSNYWPAGGNGLGWKANMDALTNALVGSKMNFDEAKIVLEGTWKFDQVTSQATLKDGLDYYKVAKRAYNNAK